MQNEGMRQDEVFKDGKNLSRKLKWGFLELRICMERWVIIDGRRSKKGHMRVLPQ